MLSTDIRAFVHEVPSEGKWRWYLDGPEHSIRVARNVTGPGGSLATRFRSPKFGGRAVDAQAAASIARVERALVVNILTVYNSSERDDKRAFDNRKQVAP